MRKMLLLLVVASSTISTTGIAQEALEAPQASTGPWASKSGLIEIKPQRKPITAQELASREAIKEVFARWGIALDEGNRAALRSLLTDDVVSTGYIGTAQPYFTIAGGDAIVDDMARLQVKQADQRRHIVSNVVIENLTANHADALAYAMVARSVRGESSFVGTVLYSGKLRRGKDGMWRFSKLEVLIDAGSPVPSR